MKLNLLFSRPSKSPARLIRTFGRAELLQHADGRWELRGGTRTDRLKAREWASLFCHAAIIPLEPFHPPAVPALQRAACRDRFLFLGGKMPSRNPVETAQASRANRQAN